MSGTQKIISNIVKTSQKIIEYSFYALFFLVPLILTPWNYELFEFNKMLVVYALTAIIICAWLIKMVVAKKFIFRRSFWDIPLGLFFISQLTSYLFSIDRHTSLWGYYSRFNGGLLSIVCYAILYWAFVSNMNFFHLRGGRAPELSSGRHLGGVIIAILSSATLVATYGIAEHFGIDAKYWIQDVRNRVFSTLGQPNWLAAWLVALMPLTWALGLNEKFKIQNSKFKIYVHYLLFTIYYLCLMFARSRSGLLGFAVAFLTFWLLVFWLRRRDWKIILRPFLIFTFSILLLSFIAGRDWIPGVEKITRLFSSQTPINQQSINPPSSSDFGGANPQMLISESSDIRKVVWKGAVDIWRHYPIFGTGPETFAYSYYWYRPREHNDLSEWDFLYNKAHNEYLNYAATTGTVGLVSYLLLIGSFAFWNLKKIINYQLSIINFALAAGFVSIVVTNFFGFSVVPVSLLFYLLPAMSFILTATEKPENQTPAKKFAIRHSEGIPRSGHSQYVTIVLILLVTCYMLRAISYYWLADTHFASGEKLNKSGEYDLAFNALEKAIQTRPFEPTYHDELAIAAANLAVLAENQKNTSLSTQMAELAITSSNNAVATSPYHLNFWKNRTKIFYKLAEIKPEYYQQALASLLRASELAPTDPKVRYNLALIYAALDQTDSAIKTLEDTLVLKPNYEDPRYALALFYEQKGERQKARQQLEYILEKINPLNQQVTKKLKTIK